VSKEVDSVVVGERVMKVFIANFMICVALSDVGAMTPYNEYVPASQVCYFQWIVSTIPNHHIFDFLNQDLTCVYNIIIQCDQHKVGRLEELEMLFKLRWYFGRIIDGLDVLFNGIYDVSLMRNVGLLRYRLICFITRFEGELLSYLDGDERDFLNQPWIVRQVIREYLRDWEDEDEE
jgi:hypothetical protein